RVCVYRSPVFRLYIQLINTCFLIVHNTLHSDFTHVGVHAEQFAHLEWCVPAERISNLPVRALIQVCGVQFQHQRPSRCVLHQARAVNCAVKHRHVIVGIQNCNSYQRCP
uniref:Secreted protein n=1 Tax=Astatotilapia calliptera TaxID=8154 RepID=A0AAX7V0F6_ASTCA